ncbi:type VII secretion-associated serine protease mycosin [Dactylosporangium sucinum]|uniref:Type VII secretion-associated serine protease n=1 Tax=Dactylosporangium sucinum TaxID=1424081 RepID=A0A917WH98_9ACTN|nr:type VII secretion-associated serine protease mycosin [Dactylosporangium sucinum]GGM03901.1 type VII secretion-associated serine protease [Dactylosporangium sucinum]
MRRRVGASFTLVGATGVVAVFALTGGAAPVPVSMVPVATPGNVMAASGSAGPVPDPARPGGPLDPARCTTPSDTMLPGTPWTQERMAPQRVWPLTTGRGVIVAVIDTGVDASVPQLAGRVLAGVDVVNGVGTADQDCYGHGTFVAGIIGAAPRTGTGMTGIAPGVTILPVRQANGPSDGTSSGLARAIRLAVDGGARVVNISASAFLASAELRAAVEYAQARDVLLVASASNEFERGNPKAYPAAFPEVIGVGAIGQDGRRSNFSEVGASVDLVAPGVNVVSLSRAAPGHLVDNGTSYSTPFVAAAAALVRAYHPRLSAAAVKRRLELTADHPAGRTPNPEVGWGVVNPYRAVTAILPDEQGAAVTVTALPAVSPVLVAPQDTRARDAAIGFAAVTVVTVVGAVVLGSVVPRGTRRRWRPSGHLDDSFSTDERGGAR